MELHETQQLALALMKEFGLASTWRFEFDSARRRFGCCYVSKRLITMSRELVLKNDQAQVEDTIRHEIAHAIAPPRSGHGHEWKKACKITGANPERCYDTEVVDVVTGDWQAPCPQCGTVYNKFRQPKRGARYFCIAKACVRRFGRWSEPLLLAWRHKNAIFDSTVYAENGLGAEIGKPSPEAKRAAIEAMKEQLRREHEMEEMKLKIAALESKLGRK